MTFFATVDDVSSAVIDIGHEETRAGYSGEDCPRSMIPSCLGVLEGAKGAHSKPKVATAGNADVDMAEESKQASAAAKATDTSVRYISGKTEIGRMRENMKILPLF